MTMNIADGINKKRIVFLVLILTIATAILAGIVRRKKPGIPFLITGPTVPQQIKNIAQVTFEDEKGNKYGPIQSNEVLLSIGKAKVSRFKVKISPKANKNILKHLTVVILNPTTEDEILSKTFNIDRFQDILAITLPSEIDEDAYDVKIKLPYCLAKKIKRISLAEDMELDFGEIPCGNLQDSDDEINSLDWAIMSENWGKKFIKNNRPEVDLNEDGIVNSLDWSIMNKNWGKRGD